MPRYFFHLVHQGGWVCDREGVELPDLRGAHAHAALVMEQATAFFDDLSDWRGWVIKITEASDRSPLILLFPAARRAAAAHDVPEPPRCIQRARP